MAYCEGGLYRLWRLYRDHGYITTDRLLFRAYALGEIDSFTES